MQCEAMRCPAPRLPLRKHGASVHAHLDSPSRITTEPQSLQAGLRMRYEHSYGDGCAFLAPKLQMADVEKFQSDLCSDKGLVSVCRWATHDWGTESSLH